NLSSYRTGGDTFENDDEDIFGAMAEGPWQYYYDHFIEARVMFENDHSAVDVGDVDRADDLDRATSDLVYAGVRASGKTKLLGQEKTLYRADLIAVAGNEDLTTYGPFGPGTRVVTGTTDQDVSGWGFDAAVDIPVPNASPLIHLGYAYGSGDDNAA